MRERSTLKKTEKSHEYIIFAEKETNKQRKPYREKRVRQEQVYQEMGRSICLRYIYIYTYIESNKKI